MRPIGEQGTLRSWNPLSGAATASHVGSTAQGAQWDPEPGGLPPSPSSRDGSADAGTQPLPGPHSAGSKPQGLLSGQTRFPGDRPRLLAQVLLGPTSHVHVVTEVGLWGTDLAT